MKLLKFIVSLFSHKMPLNVVYMFQQVEYSPNQFVVWMARLPNTMLVMHRKKLVLTKAAKSLVLVTYCFWGLIASGSVVLILFQNLLLLGLFLIALSPFVSILLLTVLVGVSRVVVVAPRERRYIESSERLFQNHPAKVIAVAGSYGKTSTKNFLASILSTKYNVLMTPESYNTTMGVVRTIREQLRPTHNIFIAEMGAKNPGDIAEICELVKPKYGIITAIGEQHLETFKTIENIINTKFELADSIPQDGIIFLNGDNEYIRNRQTGKKAVTYSVNPGSGCDYTASDISVSREGSRFIVTAPNGESCVFVTKLLGAHNIQNITGCIAVAHTLGISLSEQVLAVKRLKAVEHRLQLLPNGYIDDSYNSNPAGFRAALDVLSGFDGQRVLVTPGMVELGEKQYELNRELGSYAASCCDYAVLVGENQAPPLKEGLLKAGFPEDRLFVAKDLNNAIAIVNSLPDEGPRTVLLENDLPDNF